MPLQFRRGTDAQRTAITPAAGEPIWVTDTTKLYVGDGTTAGGIEIAGGGGTGGGAPTNLSYLVLTASTSLSAERVLTIGTGLASTDAGAGGNLTIAIATHAASYIGSGTVALARGGLAADISTTGGAGHVLKQTSAGGAVSVAALVATDLPTHNHVASNITSGTLALSVGGLAADISTTGGAGHVLKQTSAGGAVSVAALVAGDLPTHNHVASNITSGTLALSVGGLAADISTTGGAVHYLKQTAAGAAVSVAAIASTDLPTHNHVASNITSGTLALSIGGLAADISTTGGAVHFLKQTSAGAAVSVAAVAATDIGTSGTPSTSTFLRGDMTWGTPAGGGGGSGTKTYAAFTPLDNQPPTSAFATLDTRTAGVGVLDFDSTALESAIFVGCLPEAAVTTSGLKVRLAWTADTVTNTDAVVWAIQWQRIDTSTDLDTDAFSNTVTATAAASGTAGVPVITEITITGTANLDSIVAGDFYRIKISRDGTNASDALTNDACLVGVEIRDAT